MEGISNVALGPQWRPEGLENLDFTPYDTYLHPDIARWDGRTPGGHPDWWMIDEAPPTGYYPSQVLELFRVFQPSSRIKQTRSPHQNQRPFGAILPPTFLSLPVEIRFKIYGYLVEPLLDNPPLIPDRYQRLPKGEAHLAIPPTIRAQFLAILLPQRDHLSGWPNWKRALNLLLGKAHKAPAKGRDRMAVIIQPRKATEPRCCYHNYHTAPTFPCLCHEIWRIDLVAFCSCPQRTRSDYQNLADLSLVNRQINAELHRFVWSNSAVTFVSPKSFNVFAATRPSTIPLIRGITLMLDITDRQLDPRSPAHNPGDDPLEKMLLFLIKHYSPSSSTSSSTASITDPGLDLDPAPTPTPISGQPLLFFNIEFVAERDELQIPYYASPSFRDNLIHHWSPLFRRIPAESFAMHFSPSHVYDLPHDRDFAQRLRKAWAPDSAAQGKVPKDNVKCYLDWREKTVQDENGEYKMFRLPDEGSEAWLPTMRNACRCGGQVQGLQGRGKGRAIDHNVTGMGVVGRVCHLLWRSPALCRCAREVIISNER